MASALFSFIDSIGETFEGVVENVENVVGNVEKEVDSAVQQIDAGVDLDDVLEEIQLAGMDEAALLAAYKRLEGLAQCQTPAILHGWVVEDRVVPVVCAALCRVESAKLAAGPLARTLNGMGQALDLTGTTPEELRAFHEQIVRRTENGKAMLKLLQAQGLASRTQGLALLRRVYPETSAVLGRHLLSDPESISALMEILQDSKNCSWMDEAEEAALCAECVRFLRLVTAKDGDVRMIVTFQDGAEALLAIASHALSAGSSGSASFLDLAANACVCVLQLVGQGPVAQKYMREAGHLTALIRCLRGVLAALGLSEANAWAEGLRNVATVLLESSASFVSSKAGSEVQQNSKVLVQSAGLVELVCLEVLPYPQFHQLRVQAVETLSGAIRAAPEASLLCFKAMLQGRSMLDRMVAILLGEGSAPFDLREAIEVLLAVGLERSADLRQLLASELEVAHQDETPSAPGAGVLLLSAFRAADQRIPLQAAQGDWWPLDANTWFAARMLGQCIRGAPNLRMRLTKRPESDSGEATLPGLLPALLGPTAALARAWRSTQGHGGYGGDASAGLCALLQLLAEWCHDCPTAAEVLSSSPALLPELMALLESSGSHVLCGLAALVLGTCLLELPSQGVLVGSSQLMEIIASRGVDTFTRASEDFLRSLSLEKPATKRYRQGFQEFASLQFQKVQDAMVRIWLERGESVPGTQGMAEDVAGHFKDLIKMQDKELRDLRHEVQKLKAENDELRKLTTDEDKTLLLWKVGALSKQCEALQVKCDLLEAARSSVEVARLRERQINRQEREELEQQLQILALALDEAEISKDQETEKSKETQGESLESLVVERDELLAVLMQIHRSCPEAAGFLAPLGRFVPSNSCAKEVGAWEAAAERVGKQAEVISELAASHKQSVLELQERAALQDAKVKTAANGLHAFEAGGQSDPGVQSHAESHQQSQSRDQAAQKNQTIPRDQKGNAAMQAQQHRQQQAAQQQSYQQEYSAAQAQQQSQQQVAQQAQLQQQSYQQEYAAAQAQQHSQQQVAQQAQLQQQSYQQEYAAMQAAQQAQQQQQSYQQDYAAMQAQQQSQLQAQQHSQQQAAQQAQQQQQSHQQDHVAMQELQQSQLQAQQQSQLQAQQHTLQQAAQQAQQQEQKQELSQIGQENHANGTQQTWNQLPAGWVAYSTAEGHVFYYNQSTGQSQWERPG